MNWSPFLVGFSTSFSLILAIGAQNAFVLRQGLLGRHVFLVCLFCAGSDALLISLGVSGFATFATKTSSVLVVAKWAGAAFLVCYGFMRFVSAWRARSALPSDASASPPAPSTRREVLAACFAFTFLNPHVYLDTVLLMGSVSSGFPGHAFLFGLGAVCASAVFFFSLGYGAALLRPCFSSRQAWVALDALVGATMFFVAGKLLGL